MKPVRLAPREISFLLAEIPNPPDSLFVLGDVRVLSRSCLTVVGTRRPTADGLRAAFRFGSGLATGGAVVVSGLARGVDTLAHLGALHGGGPTVAVLAHGLDRIYPPENRELAQRILATGGALLTEYEPGTPPFKAHFPARNRILSGLSLGTVVIEAGPKSGSLITAGFALDQGREVYVVPGPFDAPSFQGSHRLITEGAALVSDPLEVLGFIPPSPGAVDERWRSWFADQDEATLGELFARSHLPLYELEEALAREEAKGSILRIGTQRYLWLG